MTCPAFAVLHGERYECALPEGHEPRRHRAYDDVAGRPVLVAAWGPTA